MQRTGHEFLARAALAVNQYAAACRRRERDLLPERLHGNAVAQYLPAAAQFLPQAPVLLFESQEFERFLDRPRGLFDREGFFDEVEGAQLRGANRSLDIAVP